MSLFFSPFLHEEIMIWFTLEFCNPSLSFTATLCAPIIWLLYHLKGHPAIQLVFLWFESMLTHHVSRACHGASQKSERSLHVMWATHRHTYTHIHLLCAAGSKESLYCSLLHSNQSDSGSYFNFLRAGELLLPMNLFPQVKCLLIGVSLLSVW